MNTMKVCRRIPHLLSNIVSNTALQNHFLGTERGNQDILCNKCQNNRRAAERRETDFRSNDAEVFERQTEASVNHPRETVCLTLTSIHHL